MAEPSRHNLLILIRLSMCMVYLTRMHPWAIFERHFVSLRPSCDLSCDVFRAVRSLLQTFLLCSFSARLSLGTTMVFNMQPWTLTRSFLERRIWSTSVTKSGREPLVASLLNITALLINSSPFRGASTMPNRREAWTKVTRWS